MAQKSMPSSKALESTGGSASNEELSRSVAERLKLPDEILDAPHKEDGAQTAVDYRAAWARTYLKKIGAVENSERGVWTIADKGRQIPSEAQMHRLVKEERSKARKLRNEKPDDSDASDIRDPSERVRFGIFAALRSNPFSPLCLKRYAHISVRARRVRRRWPFR